MQFFNLIKAGLGAPRPGHKYLRRYRRNNKWIYIYHEGEGRPQRMEEGHVEKLRRLADTGYAPARELLEGAQDHNEEQLTQLRRLADTGYQPAVDYLKSIGIDREIERVEEAATPPDLLTADLSSANKNKAIEIVKEVIEPMFARWRSHPNSEFEKGARRAGFTNTESFTEELQGYDNIKDILVSLNTQVSRMEREQGTAVPAWDAAKDAGGYANYIYNDTIKGLSRAGLLPADYKDAHARTRANAATLTPHTEAEHKRKIKEARAAREREAAERAERERAERERRAAEERAAAAELEGSMASFMRSICVNEISVAQTRQLHQTLKSMFGKNMRKEDWPYDYSSDGYDVKISSLSFGENEVTMSFQVKDRNGRQVTNSWDRRWAKSGGKVTIKNSYLSIREAARGADKPLGALINQSQLKFMKANAPTGKIKVTASLDVGGYNWANQGFTFESHSTLLDFRRQFQAYLRGHGIELTNAELELFTLPCHFSAFDTGKKVMRDGKRVHLGKDFLLGKTWSGVIDLEEPNEEAMNHFMNWSRLKEKSWKNQSVKNVVERVRQNGNIARSIQYVVGADYGKEKT